MRPMRAPAPAVKMSINSIFAIACAVLVAVSGLLWNRYQAADARADRAEAALKLEVANARIVTKYVDRIITVEKRVPIATRNLERLCNAWGMRGPGPADAAATPNADAGQLAGLGSDLVRCRQNAEQLSALQEVLRPQINYQGK